MPITEADLAVSHQVIRIAWQGQELVVAQEVDRDASRWRVRFLDPARYPDELVGSFVEADYETAEAKMRQLAVAQVNAFQAIRQQRQTFTQQTTDLGVTVGKDRT